MSATVNQIEDRRFATFNHTLRYVQPHATSRSTPRYVIRVNLTFAHDSSLPLTSPPLTDSAQLRSPILLTSAHRFRSTPLTESAYLHQPRTLTLPPTHEHSRFHQRTLTLPATNTHARSTNFQPQVLHSTRSRRKHNLLSFS